MYLLACLFMVKFACEQEKVPAFLLSRFIFLTYLLGIIHILHTLIYVQIYRCCLVFRWNCWCVFGHPHSHSAAYVRRTHTYQWNAHRSFVWKVECPYCYFLLAISRRSLALLCLGLKTTLNFIIYRLYSIAYADIDAHSIYGAIYVFITYPSAQR